MEAEEKYIGYLKYSGKSVEGGFLDIKKSAEALLGFDEILRYFILAENPDLRNIDYEIPVRVKKGTWGIWIPVGIVAIFTAQYLNSIAKKAGSDGFFESGPAKDVEKIFSGSIIAAQWVMKIGVHLGSFVKKEFKETVKIKQKGSEIFVNIPNDLGDMLEVPKRYFDIYARCPERIFSKNAGLIEQERVLEMGVFKDGNEERVFVTEKEKSVFYKEENLEENILFPELKHGQHILLKGSITRGNEKTNTIGFEYKGHILTCKPSGGNITIFKNKIISQLEDHFFPPVKIVGVIDRTDENHLFQEKRPQIIFSDIVPLEGPSGEQTLF